MSGYPLGCRSDSDIRKFDDGSLLHTTSLLGRLRNYLLYSSVFKIHLNALHQILYALHGFKIINFTITIRIGNISTYKLDFL